MVKDKVIGECKLCLTFGELRDSHLVPAALYRLARAKSRSKKPDPVLLTVAQRQQTSFQATQYLLCGRCETLFDQNGEDWVMRHCYRGRGRFRLRAILDASVPEAAEGNFKIYDASAHLSIAVDRLVYFCTSVFWRASVRSWYTSGQRYQGISLGNPYQEQIRRYLLGEEPFPSNAAVTVILSHLKFPHLGFNFPDTVRVDSCHCHTLHIPGMTLQLSLGRQVPRDASYMCILRAPFHPIFVCEHGDARAQRLALHLMGKTDTPWGKYPLVEGFESSGSQP